MLDPGPATVKILDLGHGCAGLDRSTSRDVVWLRAEGEVPPRGGRRKGWYAIGPCGNGGVHGNHHPLARKVDAALEDRVGTTPLVDLRGIQ